MTQPYLKELRAKSADIAMKARELFADETKQAEVSAMMAEYDAIEARIAQGEAVERAASKANALEDDYRPTEVRTASSKSGMEYSKAFDLALRSGFNKDEMSAEVREALRKGETRDGQVVGTPSAGGYMVPTLLDTQIVVAQKYYNAMTPDAVTWFDTSTGANMTIVQRDSTASKGRQISEATARTSNSITYTDVVVGSYTFTSDIYKASWELLQDASFDVAGDIADHMGESLGRQINSVLTNGAGGGSAPTGLLTAIGNAAATSANATQLSYGDFLTLEKQVDIAYRRNPKTALMFNDNTRYEARLLTDSVGRPLWQPAMQLGDQDTIFGYKYVINNDFSNRATGVAFAAFGDFSKFRVRNVKGLTLVRFNELYAASGQVGFMMNQRIDSILVDLRAIKTIKGA